MLDLLPRAVIGLGLGDEGEIACARLDGAARCQPAPAEGAALRRDPWTIIAIDRGHIGRASEREVAAIGTIGAFTKILPHDDFGDEPVKVEIALAVAMGAEVHLNPVDIGGEV